MKNCIEMLDSINDNPKDYWCPDCKGNHVPIQYDYFKNTKY